MDYIPIRVDDLIRQVNRDIYLPAIQRELVWGRDRIERLFDSIMADFPIGTFLFWMLRQENKDKWPVYEFIRDFDEDHPRNPPANMAGITKDIKLVLDGQQRIAAFLIGLCGTYRYFYYRQRETRLYLNLLKPSPLPDEENPEELAYSFSFREDAVPDGEEPQLWYLVGRILDYKDGEDAKADMLPQLAALPADQRERALKLIGRLHTRIHTWPVGYYYQEDSQDYDKVLQEFVRANSAGKPLEYSDLLLATATAQWETLDARSEIHDFTDSINEIGGKYSFGKDLVLKACLYLSDTLPIQYAVKNFTKKNSRIMEGNWGKVKDSLTTTVRLISRFGLSDKNIVAPLALLPIAYYMMKRGDSSFDKSSKAEDAAAQIAIRRWLIFSTLKNAFGSSTDTSLTRLRELLSTCDKTTPFPVDLLYKSLGIEPQFSELEIDSMLGYGYQGRYTYLVLSLLYPDRNLKDTVFHEDHIFPQSEFKIRALKRRGYDDVKVKAYMSKYNTLPNLELLTDSENTSKNATPFDEWIKTRESGFRTKHLIPDVADLGFDSFEEFYEARKALMVAALKQL